MAQYIAYKDKLLTYEDKLLAKEVGFSPEIVPDLYVWLDADDESTIEINGVDFVTKWLDKSGNEFHVGNSLVSRNPSLKANYQNNRNALEFVKSEADFLRNNDYTRGSNTTTTYYLAANVLPGSGWGRIFSYGVYRGYYIEFNFSQNIINFWINGYVKSTALITGKMVMKVVITPNDSKLYINDFTTPILTNTKSDVQVFDLVIGGGYENNYYNLDMEFYEFIAYKNNPDQTTDGKILNYLSNKWGLPITI